jgi:hypothetical protein
MKPPLRSKMMRSIATFLLLLIAINVAAFANATQRADTLSNILRSNSATLDKQKQLAGLFLDRFLRSSAYDNDRQGMMDSVKEYNLDGNDEIDLLGDIFILRRMFRLKEAEKKLLQGIEIAKQHDEKYLLFQFYINLAYVHTDQNDALAAIHNYREARKIAVSFADAYLLISADIGISDLFTTIGLYQQALIYLNEAQQQTEGKNDDKRHSRALIYLNKADVFFNLGKLDSVRHYRKLSERYGAGSYDLARNLKRLDYYSLIISKNNRQAIVLIRELLNTGNNYYRSKDRWNLAQSLYKLHKLDSAVAEANQILKEEPDGPSTIRLNTYKLLAKVADDQNDEHTARRYYKLAMEESERFIVKMRSVDLLSTELRQDSSDAAYQAQNLLYHKERVILFTSIAVATLIIFIIYLFYRSVKQKNAYQKLLHASRSQELAFINSHQVRKPLANMLGICTLLIDSENTKEDNEMYYQLLDQQLKEMDQKLREIEMKLREDS